MITIEKTKDTLRRFYQKYHRLPSYRELGALLNLKSTNAVYKIMQKLLAEHFVEQDGRRLIPHFGGVTVLGTVAAGFPTGADEADAETMSLDDFLISKREATFMLRVRGDSMIDAGIQSGDLVLVERNRTPKDGDIVIAHIDNEWTMKYYRSRGKKIYLQAANKKYPAIYPEHELAITAVVIAVVRKY